MILSGRQIKFGCANVPPIECADKPDIDGYENIVEVFAEALMKKQSFHYKNEKEFKDDMYKEIIAVERRRYEDYLSQTIHFLKAIDALKKAKAIKSVVLWKELIKMEPFYEGIASRLHSALIKKHFPTIYDALKKGKIYAYQPLTDMREAVTYIMEFFTKEGLLNEPERVIKGDAVKKWVEKMSESTIEDLWGDIK